MSNTRPRIKSLALLGGLGLLALITATLLGPVPAPASAAGQAKVPSVSAGSGHTCAVTTAGIPQCWGKNDAGQLGDGTNIDRLTPVDVCAGGPQGCTQPLTGVAAVAAGDDHTCALTTAGGVKCWGGNSYGQLGDESTSSSTTPVDVFGLTSGVVLPDSPSRPTLTAGYRYSCAVMTTGGVKCWGDNIVGQLGDGSTSSSTTPVDVCAGGTQACAQSLSDVASVAAGDAGDAASSSYWLLQGTAIHTCALTTAGGVKCWGRGSGGQLGDGTTTSHTEPVDVCASGSGTGCAGGAPITGVVAIAVGSTHSCAVTEAGGVKCWGWNSYGQLGDGQACGFACPTPVDVGGLSSSIVGITGGQSHTCALTAAGGIKCWGQDLAGQLGVDPSTAERCDASGGKGLFIVPCSTTPRDVVALASVAIALHAGLSHTCAVIELGLVMCWGGIIENTGAPVLAAPTQRSGPVNVAGLSSSGAAIAAGFFHACARTTTGGLKCWGRNWEGQLGDGQACGFTCPTPVDVEGLATGVVAVTAGGTHTCAVMTDSGVKCWGDASHGQLGNAPYTCLTCPTPVDVCAGGPQGCTQALSDVVAVAAGQFHTCALTEEQTPGAGGGVKCWGDNYYGQLGDGQCPNFNCPISLPIDVAGLTTGVVAIAASGTHTCAVTQAAGVKCWGDNELGQLGDGTSGDGNHFTPDNTRITPVDVCAGGPLGCTATLTGVATLAAGNSYTCAVTTAGDVKCWGDNSSGQLGDGTTTQRTTPVAVCAGGLQGCTQPLTHVAEVAGAMADFWGSLESGHTCAVTTSGGLKCWGHGSSGQLGDGATAQRLTPVDVIGLESGVAGVALGGGQLGVDEGHTCAFLAGAGGVRCWGDDRDGQLGIGVGGFSSTPVQAAVTGADTDGDSLLDDWETNGIDYNGDTTVDFVLPGANPNHKDIYAEVDWMVRATPTPPLSYQPDPAGIQDVIDSFAQVPNAQLNNPDGQPGITLHVTQDEAVAPYIPVLSFDSYPNQLDFADFKSGGPAACDGFFGKASERTDPNCANILGAKRLAFHYAIFGNKNAQAPGASGIGDLPGNDFFVTLGAFAGGVGTRDQQAGTFMHELGHNLGLRHGGDDSVNRKPNYLSVMNYSFQFATPLLCPNRPLDYSRAKLPSLNEESGLNEPVGIGGPPGTCTIYGPAPDRSAPGDGPIDWNRDTDTLDTNVAADINNDNSRDTLEGSNDWTSLLYDFRPSPSFASGVYDTGGEAPDLSPPDTDGDGCADANEQQTAPGSELFGGGRDYLNPNDYFNPSHDGQNRVDDVLLVVQAYFKDRWLDPPTNTIPNPAYSPDTDRTLAGPNAWNSGPPNDQQRIDDVVNMVKQYFHDC